MFFAIVVAIVLAAAWRYFEREPHQYGWSAEEAAVFVATRGLDRFAATPVVAIAAFVALAAAGAILASVVAARAIG